MQTFYLNRIEDETGVSGEGRVAQGVVFDDGTCALRWLTENKSTGLYDSLESMTAIHGHDGKTQVVMSPGARVTKSRFPPRGGNRRNAGHETKIAKVDREKQVIYGVVLDPYIVDAHDDWCPPNAIEETAHNWLTASRKMKLQHEAPLSAEPVESWLMPYPTPEDYKAAIACAAHRIWRLKFGTEWVHSGSWVLGTRVLDPAAWAQVLSGELDAYSIGGFGVRREIERVPMPDVSIMTIEAPPL